MRRAAAIASFALACGSETLAPPPVVGGGGGCAPGEATTALGCCPAGTLAGDDGSCIEPGVPPEACPAGFTAADRGCHAVLPGTCPPGRIALPGETRCR